MTKPKKYATFLLGLAILVASVAVAAAQRSFQCDKSGVVIAFSKDGLITIYPPSTLRDAANYRRYIRLNNIQLDLTRQEVTKNGKLCQEGG
jgi:hypothetical protein